MTKYKLPRKLKKGLKNLYFCKEYLTNYHQNLILKSLQAGMTSLVYAELRKAERLMLRPYPVTKWVRKAKKLKAKRFLNLSTATIPIQDFLKYMKSFDAWFKNCYGGVVRKH